MKNNYTNPNKTQRIASDPYNNVWVSASAGTGKTKILIDRLLRLMLNGVSIDRIICISFTKVAAQEMINRLIAILAKWSILEDEDLKFTLYELTNEEPDGAQIDLAKSLFSTILDTPESIGIQTIHSFCQNILSRFPIEAQVSNNFLVIEEEYEKQLKAQALESVLSLKLNKANNSERIKNNLLHIVTYIATNRFEEQINNILKHSEILDKINTTYNFNEDIRHFKQELFKQLGANEDTTLFKVQEDFFSQNNFAIADFNKLIILLENNDIEFSARGCKGVVVRKFLNSTRQEQIENYNTWKNIFFTTENTPRKNVVVKKNFKKLNAVDQEFVINLIEKEILRIEAFDKLYRNQVNAEVNLSFIEIAMEIYNKYQELKHIAGFLDYNDLIIKTYQLLQKHTILPWVMYKMDQKIDHILVDEAQDTSPLQWEIIKSFATEFFSGYSSNENERTLFVVGDIKQSIYSFQGADPVFFDNIKHFFQQKIKEVNCNWQQIPMQVSFRSSGGIISSVNHFTNQLFDTTKTPYKEEELEHLAFYNNPKNANIEIWPLLSDVIKEDKIKPKKYERYYNLALSIVKKIKLLHQEENINYGDMVILYKERENNLLLSYIVKILKDENVPILGIDKINLNSALVIKDLIALTKFLLQNSDDFSLACVLKSPIFNLNDDDIFNLCQNRKRTLFQSLNQEKYQEIYKLLQAWIAKVDYVGVYELFFEILYLNKSFTKFVKRLGKEAIDPLSEFINLILKFKNNHPDNLQSFLKFINSAEHSIKRDTSNKDNVNLMTIHSSKGLEGKVVFLLNDIKVQDKKAEIILKNNDSKNPLLLINISKEYKCNFIQNILDNKKKQDQEELKRLFYVAITRAKEQLYICSIAEKNITEEDLIKRQSSLNYTWHNIMNQAIKCNDAQFEHQFEKFEDPLFDTSIGFNSTSGYRILQNNTNKNSKKTVAHIRPSSNEIGNNNLTNSSLEDVPSLPKWLFENAPTEPFPTKPLTPSKIDFEDKFFPSPIANLEKLNKNQTTVNKGLIFHKILEQLNYIENNQDRATFINKFLEGFQTILNEKDKQEIIQSIKQLINNKDFAFLFNQKGFNEISISGSIINSKKEINIITARVDKIIKGDNTIYIIDYKYTKQKQYIPINYQKQMSMYKQLLQEIYPKYNIRCFLIFSQDPSIVELMNKIEETR